ncbi:hypothetical protein ACFWY5_34755 [Nonomuraea sp. NPDC059007]|uniref:hypothetical protein n=1 Tax=Nonomuraea sp. NPDC059007 TaxID=3346692 RepID=UPI0036C11EB0
MTTIRVRLTEFYSGLFLLTSIVLLVTVNLLPRHTLDARIARLPEGAVEPTRGVPGDRPPLPQLPELVGVVHAARHRAVGQVEAECQPFAPHETGGRPDQFRGEAGDVQGGGQEFLGREGAGSADGGVGAAQAALGRAQ